MEWLKLVHGTTPPSPAAAFGPGDEVRVWFRIFERDKERLGQFEGIVIRCRGSGPSRTFTVRRVTHGEGVERVFPMDAKTISRIEVLRQGQVRRSRLYFLRRVIGKTRLAPAQEGGAAPAAQKEQAGGEAKAGGALPQAETAPIVSSPTDVQVPSKHSGRTVVTAEKPHRSVTPQS
jgi:large subunit ribosomal protein L19